MKIDIIYPLVGHADKRKEGRTDWKELLTWLPNEAVTCAFLLSI